MHFSITNGDSFDKGRLGSVDSIIKNRRYRVAFPVSFSKSEFSWERVLFLFWASMIMFSDFIIYGPTHRGVQQGDMANGAGIQLPIPGLHRWYTQMP